MYFRLSNDVRNIFIQFFQKLFALYSENKITFVDGRNKIDFTVFPKCLDMDTFDFKYFPSLLIGLAPGYFKDVHFNKFRGLDVTDTEGSKIYGGVVELTLTFQVYATTREDRNNLADLTSVYLTKYDTKALFEQQYGIRLTTPSLSGDFAEDDPQTNLKMFYTNISLPVHVDFEDQTEILDSQGRKLTLANVISYNGDTNSDGEIDVLYSNTIP